MGMCALSATTLFELAQCCGEEARDRLSAAVSFGISEYTASPESGLCTAQSTVFSDAVYPSTLMMLFALLKGAGAYLVFIGVMLLVVLELLELYYVQKIFQRRRA